MYLILDNVSYNSAIVSWIKCTIVCYQYEWMPDIYHLLIKSITVDLSVLEGLDYFDNKRIALVRLPGNEYCMTLRCV